MYWTNQGFQRVAIASRRTGTMIQLTSTLDQLGTVFGGLSLDSPSSAGFLLT